MYGDYDIIQAEHEEAMYAYQAEQEAAYYESVEQERFEEQRAYETWRDNRIADGEDGSEEAYDDYIQEEVGRAELRAEEGGW